jgi:DNA-binding HxlR family transcriptional regulator
MDPTVTEQRSPSETPSDLTQGPLADALAAVGDRWTLLVIAALLEGPLRFGELQERLAGIAPNVLSQRLRHLQDLGLVLAEPYSDRPPRFTYELSARGHDLAGALRLLARWAEGQPEGEPARHESCGTPLEKAWFCPVCNEVVTDVSEEDEVRFV